MNAFSKIDMGEVTRLTQAGKLAEAMALLQGLTASSIARGSPSSEVPRSTLGIKRPSPSLPTIDMIAPSVPGGAWTAPTQFKQRAAGESVRPAKAAGLPDLAQMMLAFRGLPKLGALSTVGDGLGTARQAPVRVPEGARFEERTFSNDAEVGPTRCTCLAAIRVSPSRSWSCCTAALRTQTTSPLAHG
jgi:hypothetical protein